MTDDTTLPFAFPAAQRKKVTAAFDGGRMNHPRRIAPIGDHGRQPARPAVMNKTGSYVRDVKTKTN